MTRREGNWDPTTRLEKIQFLAEGSPTLRYILSQVKDTTLIEHDPDGHPNKLIILEDTPLTAWLWELVLNALYIETGVLHSGLSNGERCELVKRFNDQKSSLKAIVLMYAVGGAQGVNLDTSCRRVLVATSAPNASLEIQGRGRAIRVC